MHERTSRIENRFRVYGGVYFVCFAKLGIFSTTKTLLFWSLGGGAGFWVGRGGDGIKHLVWGWVGVSFDFPLFDFLPARLAV